MVTTLLRLSGPALAAGGVLIVAAVTLELGIGPAYLAGLLLAFLGVVGQVARNLRQRPRVGSQRPAAIPTTIPVAGRWRALNSPGSKVPSHGIHTLAQTYAIDITYEEEGTPPRRIDPLWPIMRRPASCPSFGRPVLAPFDGVVVSVEKGRRDHLTRMSTLGIAYLVLEGFVRSLGASSHLLGNHVVVRAADGEAVALLAHLRRGSVRVVVGDRVRAGQALAECGNSGNSSDPHLHFQLMTDPDVEAAHGLPFEWTFVSPDGEVSRGAPANTALFQEPPRGRRQPVTSDGATGRQGLADQLDERVAPPVHDIR